MYYARDFVKAKDDPTAPDAHDLVYQPDTVDEFTVTYNKVFLGLNLACISCHDGQNHLEKVNLFSHRKETGRLLSTGRLLREDTPDHELGKRLPGRYGIHGG